MRNINLKEKFHSFTKFGYVGEIGSPGTNHDLWYISDTLNRQYPPAYVDGDQPGGYDIYISSSNNADDQTIVISGLDGEGKWQVSEKQLQGQTKTLVNDQFFRVFDAEIKKGDNFTAGIVYVYLDVAVVAGVPSDLSKVQSFININNDNSLQCHFTVPFNMRGWLDSYKLIFDEIETTRFVKYGLWTRKPGDILRVKNFGRLNIYKDVEINFDINYDIKLDAYDLRDFPLDPGEDFLIQIQPSASDDSMSFSITFKAEDL